MHKKTERLQKWDTVVVSCHLVDTARLGVRDDVRLKNTDMYIDD